MTFFPRQNNIHSGSLILVNAEHPLVNCRHHRYIPAMGSSENSLLEQKAASVLASLLQHIRCKNRILPVSGYRSREEQEKIYQSSLQKYGETFTRAYVALPDHSEHQTGLAIDLALNEGEIDFIRPYFPYSGICERFRKAAPAYGFVERYKKEKEPYTGIAHEPWHFRYVSYPHSQIMENLKLSLEEYTEYIKQFPYGGTHLTMGLCSYMYDIFYLEEGTEGGIEFPPNHICEVSGNNVDGFVVTAWRK